MPNRSPESLISRYERAAALAPANVAAELLGSVIDGYWLSDRHFFCRVTDVGIGGLIERPLLLDAYTGSPSFLDELPAVRNLLRSSLGELAEGSIVAEVQYDMPRDGKLAILIAGRWYQLALDQASTTQIDVYAVEAALFSPDGRHSAIARENSIWKRDLVTGLADPFLPAGEPLNGYGMGPISGTQPLAASAATIPHGLWSSNSRWFATHRIDERAMPDAALLQHSPDDGGLPVLHSFKFSPPGSPPPVAEFACADLLSNRIVSPSCHPPVGIMSPFCFGEAWFSDKYFLFIDRDRFSSEISLVAVDLDTDEVRRVVQETAYRGWIDAQPDFVGQPLIHLIEETGDLLWWSERDGFGHLYRYDFHTGELQNQVTQGEWMVREILHVDVCSDSILFLASGLDNSFDKVHRQICRIRFDGSGLEAVTDPSFDLAVAPIATRPVNQFRPFRPSYAPSGVSPDGRYAVARASRADMVSRTLLVDLTTRSESELLRVRSDTLSDVRPPLVFDVTAADGETTLYGAIYLPSDFDPRQSYPLLDYAYPGPQVNWFTRRWPNPHALFAQATAELGFAVLMLETRGMPYRNRAFHQAGTGSLLEPQLSDHVVALDQLCARHAFLRRDLIGIMGSSGGGHAAARAIFDYPSTFKVAVSVCGNHDSQKYSRFWIDKYGGRPGSTERRNQSNLNHVGSLIGKLLLIHGDMDDNVHPAQTIALSDALMRAGKQFEQLIVPNSGHAVLFESPLALRTVWKFLVRHLLDADIPDGVDLSWPRERCQQVQRMFAERR